MVLSPSLMPSSVPLSTPEKRIRILISDRNRMASHLLAESLSRDPDIEVACVAAGDEVLSSALTHKPDLAVVSAEFDGGSKTGLQIVRTLSSRQPKTEIVVLIDGNARGSVLAAFRCGAKGVFSRSEPPGEFRACIERVSRGEIWAGRKEAEFLLAAVRNSPSCDGIDDEKVNVLSKRELEVAECAAQGQSNKQIADQLHLSEHTVKNYLFRIFDKMGVSNRFELLFLLYNARDNSRKKESSKPPRLENQIQKCLKAAEAGFAPAQYALGLAYMGRAGFETNAGSAYYWLRVAEESSAALYHRCHDLAENLKAKLSVTEIEVLEANIARAGNRKRSLDSEHSIETVQHHLELLPL
jgi:two-component system nitrate/nitrite response regulator NarL